MNKVNCEICGTVYPDNASQCPICGYPRKPENKPENGEIQGNAATERAYQPVKGGRFSNSNVKKRNQPAAAVHEDRPKTRRVRAQEPQELDDPEQPQENKGNRGLVVTAIVLLVAVICVGAYIGLRFFWGADAYDKAEENTQPSTQTVPAETDSACTDIEISDISLSEGVEFMGQGRGWRLNVTTVPENTIDELTVSSSDESVVTVSVKDNWVELVSVAPGKATITVSCGSVSKQFPVVCSFEQEETEPVETQETEPVETEATEPATEETLDAQDENWKLNYTDASIGIGYSFELTLTNDAGEVAPITWTCSNDAISINGNTITGVALDDYMEVRGTYNGQTYMCIVRVLAF